MKQKMTLCLLLVVTNILLVTGNPTEEIFPFIPPLTHTPGMGLGLIGEPQPPPFVFLPRLQHTANKDCIECRELQEAMQKNLETGKKIRLTIQERTLQLLDLLPERTMKQALLHRSKNEHRIGEVSVWERLER